MKRKILICDDDDILIGLAKNYLEIEGYDVDALTDSAEIYEEIDHFKPDVIIVDLQMPNVTGNEIIRELKGKEATKKIPVILWSGNLRGEEIAESSGANYFLPKPLDLENLERILEEVRDIKSY